MSSVALTPENELRNDVGLSPFLVAAGKETRTQRALREALAHVQQHGLCECAPDDQPDGFLYFSVCGLPMQSDPPSPEALAAARLVLSAVARGSGGEDDCVGLDYGETLKTIMIFFDVCDFTDAQACSFIEEAYASAGHGPAPSWPSGSSSVIRLT